eukprot:SM000048S16512  [mRNA]  locus=s48:87760:90516:+ [translate_table: standard]
MQAAGVDDPPIPAAEPAPGPATSRGPSPPRAAAGSGRRGDSLTWTAAAEARIFGELDRLQHPSACDRPDVKFLAVQMDVSGLMWNFQSFVRALLLGLQLNRTVVPVALPPGLPQWQYAAFFGCDNMHLGCFFPNITSCWLPAKHQELSDEPAFTWNFTCASSQYDVANGSQPHGCSPLQNALRVKQHKILHLHPMNGVYPGWLPQVGPLSVWEELVAAGAIVTMNDRPPPDLQALRPQQPIFFFHAVISRWLFRPTVDIQQLARLIIEQHPGWRPPVAAVHIRRTDKRKEDPFWAHHGQKYRSIQSYLEAVKSLEGLQNKTFESLFLLSDSEVVVKNITTVAPDYYGLRPTTTILYNKMLDRSVIEENGGHVDVPHNLKLNVTNHFLATLQAMLSVTDAAVGTLSSNVFRVIMQLIGGKDWDKPSIDFDMNSLSKAILLLT